VLANFDFASIVRALPLPRTTTTGGLVFSVATAPGIAPVRLGKSIEGEPAILFRSNEVASQRAPIELRHLSVLFGARCRVSGESEEEEEEEAHFTVVWCHGDDPLQDYFMLMAKTLLSALGPDANETSVEKTVLSFVELFRAAAKSPAYALRGLWGELLVIARSADPVTVLRAWHIAAIERFDFGAGNQRVEVKTAGRASRRHHFSLEQLVVPDLEVCVASIQVEPSAAGPSLRQLVDDVASRLTQADDAIRLTTTVGAVLGTDWTEYSSARFDDTLAFSSLRFYRADAVPRVILPLPLAVTQVEFVSDVSASETLSPAALSAAGGLWSAIRPE
jgi:hypothetical protein